MAFLRAVDRPHGPVVELKAGYVTGQAFRTLSSRETHQLLNSTWYSVLLSPFLNIYRCFITNLH